MVLRKTALLLFKFKILEMDKHEVSTTKSMMVAMYDSLNLKKKLDNMKMMTLR